MANRPQFHVKQGWVYAGRMAPTIGRIVIYHSPGSADGKYPSTDSPAIVQGVAPDGTCRLWVFGPKGLHTDDGLKEGVLLRAKIAQLRKALQVAINTVECASVDTDGSELPWYVGAKAALRDSGSED